jgi:hypothetical protein
VPPKKKPRKPFHEMTSDELARHVFPPQVHRHLKKLANPQEGEKPPERESRSQDKDK